MNRKVVYIIILAYFGLSFDTEAQEYLNLMQGKKADFYTIRKAAEEYFDSKGKGRTSGYKQYKRWEWFMEERVYPSGDISLVNSGNLYNEVTAFKENYPDYKSTINEWEAVPMIKYDNVDGHWSPGTGRLDRVMVDPGNPDIIYVGAPTGGLWKSTDGGASWEAKTDNLPTIGICGIAIDHTNTDIIYVATGDGDGGGTYSSGIFKSVDGGETWMPLDLAFSVESNIEGKKLIIHPVNPDILFFTSSAGIFKTTDAGNTWLRVQDGSFDDIEFKPGDPCIVYATKNDSFYRSDNTGDSFSEVAVSASGRMIIGVTKAAPSYVYLASGNEGIFLSDDNGKTFKFVGDHPFTKALKWYMWAFAVSQTDPDLLHIGEIESYKSTDGGLSWSVKTTEWLWGNNTGYTHCDFHEMKYFGETLYVCTDGGLAKTTDEGESWTVIFNGIETTQIYNIGVCMTDESKVMFGSQDNGVYYHNNYGWWGWLGADGMDVVYDYNNPATRYATIQDGEIYCSDHNISQAGTGGWTTPLAIHPENPDILYIATDVVRKSVNRMQSWETIGDVGSGYKKALAVAQSDPDYIYVSEGSSIWVTKNGGTNWTDISGNIPDLTITDIAVHPSDPEIVAVALSGYTKGEKVYISYDAGATWENYSKNLPNIPANSLVFDDNTDNSLYVGMDAGVYYTDDIISLYEQYSLGFPDVIVRDLEIYYDSGLLFAGTFGRGVWKVKTASSVIADIPGIAENPVPANGSGTVSTMTELEWEPGSQSVTHRIYFGSSSDPEFITEQDDMTFDPGALTAGTKYYWRIDEVNGIGVKEGDVWSFTTDYYCPASGREGTTADYITRVKLGSVDNISGKSSYTNYTNLVCDLIQGEQYSITVSMNYHWDADYVCAWIDWDRDMILSEDERLNMSVIGTDNNSTGVFDVPADAVEGETRLRVRSIYDSPIDPCGDYYGEVEDYTVNIKAVNEDLPSKAGNPYPVNNALNIPGTTLVTWSPGIRSTNHDIYFGKVFPGEADVTEANQTDTLFDPGLLERSTTYYWRVDEVNTFGKTAGEIWSFTTDKYCPAVSEGTEEDTYIAKVFFGEANNPSGFEHYFFYKTISSDVMTEEELSIDVELNDYTGYEKVYAWIDWNNDNEFRDEESINMSDVSIENLSSGSVIVPPDAIQGTTRLRVRMTRSGYKDPCNTYSGETEDYVLIVKGVPEPPDQATALLPVNGTEHESTLANLMWKPGERADSHDIYFGTDNPPGFRINQTDTIFDPEILTENTTYFWRVDEINAGGKTTGETWSFKTFDSNEHTPMKVDFGTDLTPVDNNYSAYIALNNKLESFADGYYGALGSNITMSLSWAAGASDSAALMVDRGGNDNTLSPDLLRDWVGTDTKKAGNPLKITLKDLPEGTYKWTSYHHDPHEQTGLFSVIINDAAGTYETDYIDISNGRLTLNNISKFVTTIESDGSDVELIFNKLAQEEADKSCFVMNAFALDTVITEGIDIIDMDNEYLNIYPNPVRDILNVEYAPAGRVKIMIFDREGRIIYTGYHSGNKARIGLESCSNGFYNLVLYKNKMFISRKFIINR